MQNLDENKLYRPGENRMVKKLNGELLSSGGERLEDNEYYHRCLQSGDIVPVQDGDKKGDKA